MCVISAHGGQDMMPYATQSCTALKSVTVTDTHFSPEPGAMPTSVLHFPSADVR